MAYPVESRIAPLAGMILLACSAGPGTNQDAARVEASQEQRLTGSPPLSSEAVLTDLARELVAAPPEAWQASYGALIQGDGDRTQALLRALERQPRGAGVQLALATLGKLGDPAATAYLEAQLSKGNAELSSEAALALGRLPSPASIAVLQAEMDRSRRDPLVRTAAAVALLDLGEVELSLPFLHAILLAGTPYGLALQQEFALPDRGRWAHERYLAISAIGRHFDGETFGLDPDSSWPSLKASVDRLLLGVLADHALDLRQSREEKR